MYSSKNTRNPIFIILFVLLFSNIQIARAQMRVLKIQDNLALINVGSAHGFKKGDKLIVKRLISPDYRDVGKAKIIQTQKDRAAIRLEKKKNNPLKRGDFLFQSDRQFKEEVGNFWSIPWGVNHDDIPGMTFEFTKNSAENIKFYSKQNEVLSIGPFKIEHINYGFWQDRFYCVKVKTTDYVNFMGLKEAITSRFGNPVQPDKYMDHYFWSDNNTERYMSPV